MLAILLTIDGVEVGRYLLAITALVTSAVAVTGLLDDNSRRRRGRWIGILVLSVVYVAAVGSGIVYPHTEDQAGTRVASRLPATTPGTGPLMCYPETAQVAVVQLLPQPTPGRSATSGSKPSPPGPSTYAAPLPLVQPNVTMSLGGAVAPGGYGASLARAAGDPTDEQGGSQGTKPTTTPSSAPAPPGDPHATHTGGVAADDGSGEDTDPQQPSAEAGVAPAQPPETAPAATPPSNP